MFPCLMSLFVNIVFIGELWILASHPLLVKFKFFSLYYNFFFPLFIARNSDNFLPTYL
jgi:hypothetical protein